MDPADTLGMQPFCRNAYSLVLTIALPIKMAAELRLETVDTLRQAVRTFGVQLCVQNGESFHICSNK
jgi:hypothetical protein